MKKCISVLLATIMMLSSGFVVSANTNGSMENFKTNKTYTAGQFVDVSNSDWYAENVKMAYELSLVNGTSDTTFSPNSNLTIAEAITLASRMNNIYYGNTYSFVSGDVWYQTYVDYAIKNGIIKNNEYSNFDAFATRYQFAEIFSSALPGDALQVINQVADNSIPDVPMQSSYANAVYKLYRAGILTGNDANGTFAPNTNIQRSAVAAIVSRMANVGLRKAVTLSGVKSDGLMSAEEIYEKCSPAVFYIEVYNENGSVKGSGSGFFIDEMGTAVTNFHVIDGCASARITTSDTQKTYNVLGVYNYNISEDWAVIKVDCVNHKALEFGGENSLIGGATVYTIGSPLGLQNTISQGLISNPKRYEDGINYIQISAAISQGSSGGALLDARGRVIGITSASYVDGQNLNLAIPISYVDTDTKGELKQFAVLEKTVEIADPVQYLQDFLVEHGTADALPTTVPIINYSLKMEDVNGAIFTISYTPSTETMYIEKEYSTKYNTIGTNLYFSGEGTNESATLASFSFHNDTEWTAAYASVNRELVKYPEYFSFYWMKEWKGAKYPLSQDAGEEICYGMILDIIDAADYMFSYYNLPITMRDFGYVY